jgi:hypothetical protein
MATKIERNKAEAWRLLFRFKLQKLRWKFKQVFLLCPGSAMVYWAWMKLYLQGRDLYLLYWVVWIWLIPFRYWLKWVFQMLVWWILKSALIRWWARMEAVIYKIEYIESWSTYQKWTFIFARPKGGLLEGMGVIFKSERLSFSIPPEVLRPWDIITVYVSKWNSSNYWMDIKDAFYRIIES